LAGSDVDGLAAFHRLLVDQPADGPVQGSGELHQCGDGRDHPVALDLVDRSGRNARALRQLLQGEALLPSELADLGTDGGDDVVHGRRLHLAGGGPASKVCTVSTIVEDPAPLVSRRVQGGMARPGGASPQPSEVDAWRVGSWLSGEEPRASVRRAPPRRPTRRPASPASPISRTWATARAAFPTCTGARS